MAFSDSQSGAVVIPVSMDGVSSVTLSGTVTKGDPIGFSSGWKRAFGAATVIQMRCVALEDGVAGQRVAVCFGECYMKGARFSGGTANNALYVSEEVAGEYEDVIPDTATDATTRVGTMLSGVEAILTPNYNVDSVV